MSKLDFTKPITTRDGRKVTIYCTDAPSEYPIHGRVENETIALSWSSDGRYTISNGKHHLDLINVEEARYVWINLYRDHTSFPYPTLSGAVCGQSTGCIGRMKIKLEPGRWDE